MERYFPPNYVPCSVCSVVYPLSEYESRSWDFRPVVCQSCHQQIDRENADETGKTYADVVWMPFTLSEAEAAFVRHSLDNGLARPRINLRDDNLIVVE